MAGTVEEEVSFGFDDAIGKKIFKKIILKSIPSSTTNLLKCLILLILILTASGLNGFLGTIPTKSFPTPTSGTSPSSEKQAIQYLAGIITASLSQQQSTATTTWSPHAAEAFEIYLRSLVRWASPTPEDRRAREGVISRLCQLAESGIRFCRGLHISAYGSFTSGLYTPHGDLDLSIEGVAIMDDYTGEWAVPVENMTRKDRENFLRALAGRVRARAANKVLKIPHARVPIIKFEDHITRVQVDVAIDSLGAQFKSVAVGVIASIDWRVGALVRLIKLWARYHNLNDSSMGTFNSFALTLLVIFHCQTRSPAILPPLAELFGCSTSIDAGDEDNENSEERPMHNHRRPDLMRLRIMQQEVTNFKAANTRVQKKLKNQETLLELLSSFFSLFQGLMKSWNGPDEALSRVLCRVRVDTWHGCLKYRPWADKRDGTYRCSIEDPFDSMDNVGRTIRDTKIIDRILLSLDKAVHICTERVTGDFFEHGLEQLFGAEVLEAADLNDSVLLEKGKLQDRTAAVLPTELWVPESLKEYVLGTQQPFAAPEKNGPRGVTNISSSSSLGGGDGDKVMGIGISNSFDRQLCPYDIFSPGAVLEFPRLTLQGKTPFSSRSSGTGAGTGTSRGDQAAGTADEGGCSSPMDLDDAKEDKEESDIWTLLPKLPGSLYWDGLHRLLEQTTAVLAVEAAEEAVREAEKEARRAARKKAKQAKEKIGRKWLEKSGNDGGDGKKTAVEERRNGGEGEAAAAAATGEKPQGEGGQRPNRRERRRHGGGRGRKTNGAAGNGGGTSGTSTNNERKQNGGGGHRGKPQPGPDVLVVPRPPQPPPGH